MRSSDRFTRAQVAFAVLKAEIDQRHPHGWFVAITGGTVVASADSFDALAAKLAAQNLKLADVAVDQAGIATAFEYLGWIATSALLGHWAKCVLPAGNQEDDQDYL